MGGSIKTIIIRDEKQNILDGYTNSLPEFVKTDKFIDGDKEWIDEYIKCYYNSKMFTPNDYGLDIFNFDKKEILTCQCYCSYNNIEYTSISLYMGGHVLTTTENQDKPPFVSKRMWDKGMIRLTANFYDEKNKKFINTDNVDQKSSYEDSFQYLKDNNPMSTKIDRESLELNQLERYQNGIENLPSSYKIRWEDFGWKLKTFEDSFEGSIEMLDYCIANGYKISKTEIDEWVDWRGEYMIEDGELTEKEFKAIKLKYVNYLRKLKIERLIENNLKKS